MFCHNCGTTLETGTMFCGNCGAKQKIAGTSAQATTAATTTTASQPNPQVEQVKAFFKNNLMGIVKSIFKEPIKGTLDIFTNAKAEAYQHALILIITTGIFYILVPYIFMGDARRFIEFNVFFKVGISVIISLLLISTLTFLIKSISGKPDFKKELLTGGMCGIPLMIFLLILGIIKFFSTSSSLFDISPQDLINSGVMAFIIFLYLLLMLFNIVQQSLKSSKTNDGLSWWLSPLVICLSFYITFQISKGMF